MTLINLPTSSCLASVTLTLTRAVGSTQSPFTFDEQLFKWPGEAWSIEFSMPPFNNRALAADWYSFGLKLEGSLNTFLIGDPLGKNPRGVASGTPLVDGAGQSGNILSTKGWTPDIAGIMLKGDYIQIGTGNNARLHMVVEDANSDSSGDASLSIVPALRTPPADNAAIIVSNARGVFRLNSNSFSWSISPGPVYRLNFSAREAINA